MYCIRCGKPIPEGASFCAFCGHPVADEPPIIESELLPERDAPEGVSAEGDDAHAAYMRPDPSRQVKPLPDNPAQPSRRARREAEEKQDEPEAAREPVQASRPAEQTRMRVEPDRPRQAPPRQERAVTPDKPARGAVASDRPARGAVASDRPARGAVVSDKPARGAVVSDGRVMKAPPSRKPPIKPKKSAAWEAANTLIPKRRKKSADDLFFDYIDQPDETPYDDEEDERSISRKLKSAIAAISLLVILGVVFWLLVLPGGQRFRASAGMNAPASAYASLGDQYLRDDNLKRAADAYYTALRRDPENYDYSLMVAKTQALIGDRNRALSAYAKCMTLRPEEAEPYQAVADLYKQMGESDRAAQALRTGYDKTGDLDLFRAYEEMTRKATPTGEPAA